MCRKDDVPCPVNSGLSAASRLMVGYGAHTAVPHITSPLFSLLSRYMDNLEVAGPAASHAACSG